MRASPLALFSGIGSRVAWAIIACGLVVLVCGLLLQAGKQQRQYRELHQQQLRQAAGYAALALRNRVADAHVVLRSYADAPKPDEARLREQLLQTPIFDDAIFVDATDAPQLQAGARRFMLDSRHREALARARPAVIRAVDADSVYLMRELSGKRPQRWVLAQMRAGWLWSSLTPPESRMSMLVVDAAGKPLHGAIGPGGDMAALFGTLPASGNMRDLEWVENDQTQVGALVSMGSGAVVMRDVDRPWSAAFWSALRTQSASLPLLLALAAWFAWSLGRPHQRIFRQLRLALSQLPGRRLIVQAGPDLVPEVRQLVDSYNRSAEALEAQAEIRKVVDDIDGLLLPGGDHENVIDQVLTRVRGITRANNVGLTLIDGGVATHGRMFLVNAAGGCPVNRVVLDEQMLATLRDSKHGLTVVRCEEGRHSFLEPLQTAGSQFFWVWPVFVEGNLAAILSVGYVDPPAHGAQVAGCGSHCAHRLGVALSSNARAEQLYRQAHFDPLTQLPNRLLFRDQLAQDMRNIDQNDARGALLYIDLDHFKKINDSLGHSAGDKVLSIVAQRLRACVKEVDTVARLGGDEFTVILRDVHEIAAVSAVAERMIHSIQQPVRLAGADHHVQASIGIALFPLDGTDLDELVRNADLAMYRAKDLGRGAAVFYTARMAEAGARVVDSGMFRALRRREFSLYYQPQYRISDGALVAVEALLRWNRPPDGMVPPAQFIPAAEETGLIIDLGGWVIDAVCAQIAQWGLQGVVIPRVSMNLSMQQLRDPELVTNLQRSLQRHGVAPAAVELEMNEAALTDGDSQPGIAGLSQLGVRLTLDDFGTGHTALANLRRYPVAAVKIDHSFVDDLARDASAAALASAIIAMAHSLGKQVVAEGVETIEQLEYLRERGCDFAQGFFMAQPLSSADMTELLIGRNADSAGNQSAFA